MKIEQRIIEETIEEYYKAFTEFKPHLISRYNNIPLMFVTKEKVVSINTRIGFWLVFKFLMSQLKKQKYGSSKFTSKGVRFLNENMALVDGAVSRYTIDEEEIETFSFVYTMRKVDGNWKIVVGTYP